MKFQDAKIVGEGVDSERYHQESGLRGTPEFVVSQGALREFERCPLRWVMGYTPPESTAKQWGSMLDCMLLTPDDFEGKYPLRPDTYPAPAKHEKVKKGEIKEGDPLPWNANAAICREWEEGLNGRKAIKSKTYSDLTVAAKRLRVDPVIEDLLESSVNQVWVTANYHDSETGLVVPCKALIDGVPRAGVPVLEHCLWDLKTTRSALPEAWLKWAYQAGLYIQAAWYLDLFNAATGEDRSTWLWVLQENFPPFEVGRRMLSQSFIELGRLFYRSALARYCLCLKTGVWPGYDAPDGQKLPGWTEVTPLQWMLDRGLPYLGSTVETSPDEDGEMPEEEVIP